MKIALDPESPSYVMPELSDTDQIILDIGCGIGQTFVALKNAQGRFCVGVDIDLECLTYGYEQFPDISFVSSAAEHLPFHDNIFDFVFSRACLLLTNIPNFLAEAKRVLRPNGRVWFNMIPLSLEMKYFRDSVMDFCFIFLAGNLLFR